MTRRNLLATPLAAWERDGLKAALVKAGLPADDVGDARLLFWRFETTDIPVGFGGLEIHGSDALLRSLVTLPPLRQIGMGAAMVAVLETEARALKCRAIYLPDRVGCEFLRPARLCALRAQRRAGSDPRQPTIRRVLRAHRGRDGQAYRLVPRTRSSRTPCGKCGRELRVKKGH